MVPFQGNELPSKFDSPVRKYHTASGADPLKVHLAAHRFDGAIRSLIPFYGPDCPVAVYADDEAPGFVGRATLGAIDGWSPRQPLLLVIG